mgnify:CR=1 FL=1
MMNGENDMRLKKKITVMMVVVMVLSMLVMPYKVEAAKKIKLSKTKITLTVGSKTQLKLKNAPKGKTIKWTTNNKKIAAVTQSGIVRAKKKGTAKITAKLSGKKYICKVTVKAKETSTTTEKTTEAPAAPTPAPADTEAPKNTDTPQNTEAPKNTETPKTTEDKSKEDNKKTYTVIYDANGGAMSNTEDAEGNIIPFELTSEYKITAGEAIKGNHGWPCGREGKSFIGWKTNGDTTLYKESSDGLKAGESYIGDYIPTGNVTFFAQWVDDGSQGDNDSLVSLENTEGKRESDVKALQKIITKQLALGAEVSRDLDSDEYWWTENDGILDELQWTDKGLQGDLDLTGLKDITKVNVGIQANNKLTTNYELIYEIELCFLRNILHLVNLLHILQHQYSYNIHPRHFVSILVLLNPMLEI